MKDVEISGKEEYSSFVCEEPSVEGSIVINGGKAEVTMQTNSMKKFSDTPLWNSKNNKRMWSYYCKNLKGEEIYSVSPMHNSLPQIIPDTYIETAEYDCLHDEGILYGKKLREAGANVEINETRGTIHGYDSALNTKIAIGNIEKRILFLKKALD